MSDISEAKRLLENGMIQSAYNLANELYNKNNNDYNTIYIFSIINFKLDKIDEANHLADRLLDIEPSIEKGYMLKLDILNHIKDDDNLIQLCNQANKYNINNDELTNQKSISLTRLQKYDLVLEHYNSILIHNPKNAYTLTNIARTYALKYEYKIALEYFDKAIIISPKDSKIYLEKAKCLIKMAQYEKALKVFQKITKLKPSDNEYVYEFAFVYCIMRKYDKALSFYKKQTKKYPHDLELLKRYSFALFKNTQFNESFNLKFEPKRASVKVLDYMYPNLYDNTTIENNNILIVENEGIGDNIQFMRYAETLYQYGANQVYYYTQKNNLNSILNTNKIKIISTKEEFKSIDYAIQIQSLHRIFTHSLDTIPKNIDIFDFEYTKMIEIDSNKLNIGFIYRGNTEHQQDFLRSIFDTTLFERIFNIPNTQFYSLQYDNNKDVSQMQTNHQNIFDCKPIIKDLKDTANIIQDLDLVITIDSSIAHLSASLDVPTWIMLDTCNDWRWLINGDTSIWYDSVRLFRQKKANDWNSVFKDIYKELLKQPKLQ